MDGSIGRLSHSATSPRAGAPTGGARFSSVDLSHAQSSSALFSGARLGQGGGGASWERSGGGLAFGSGGGLAFGSGGGRAGTASSEMLFDAGGGASSSERTLMQWHLQQEQQRLMGGESAEGGVGMSRGCMQEGGCRREQQRLMRGEWAGAAREC